MHVLKICMPMQHLCAWYFQKLEEGIRSPRTGVIDSCHVRAGTKPVSSVRADIALTQ